MQATLERAVRAFAAGDYVTAAAAFADLERVFGREESYSPLAPTLLPVRAYAEQQAGNQEAAITHFEDFLRRYPDERARLGFVYFNLARAYQVTGRKTEAINAYQRFIEAMPDTDEAILSAMRQAELYFEAGELEQGISRLLNFSESTRVAESLRVQARLRALQKIRESGDESRAAKLLLDSNWSVTEMPELAVLAFAALQTSDYLLEQERPTDALRVLRLVPRRETLIRQQERQLEAITALRDQRREQATGPAAGAGVWDEYFRNLLGRMQGQLDALLDSEDYTPGLDMRRGQAYLLAGRTEEAEIIFRALADDETAETAMRAQAHYRLILAAHARQDWDTALAYAHEFQQAHSDDPNAPAALFLLAHALQQQGDYAQAVAVLDGLVEDYPQHAMQPRWIFARGHNRILNQQAAAGRNDFQFFLERWPQDAQASSARLWLALSHFFEREYAAAIAAFDMALTRVPEYHHLYPELIYRRANTLYSMADYDSALQAIDAYLKSYPQHQRVPEARVLRGDILMGKGRLLEASSAFLQVSPEAGALYPYAVFQRGKILQALEEYPLMIEHFENYVQREDVAEKVRVAEALYWIGWAWTQKGSPEKAFPAFMRALEAHGNERRAGEVAEIIRALGRLHAQAAGDEVTLFADTEAAQQLLDAESIEAWLWDERERAEQAEQWTWYSRIALYLADLAKRRNETEQHERQVYDIFENVDIDRLDGHGLAEVGALLARDHFQAAELYLQRCLDDFPGSPHRGLALYALASLAYAEGDPDRSRTLLERFQAETPAHPRVHDATLLQARVLADTGHSADAVELLEALLRIRQARGLPHARALNLIGDIYAGTGDNHRAIAYYQRVYTLYRAFAPEVAHAYLKSASLFEETGDVRAAYNSLVELKADPRLADQVDMDAVNADLQRLKERLPTEAAPERGEESAS